MTKPIHIGDDEFDDDESEGVERFQEGVVTIELGQWYWVNRKKDGVDQTHLRIGSEWKDKEGKHEVWYGCVMKIGSNYVELRGVNGSGTRIHMDSFLDACSLEHKPDDVIRIQVETAQGQLQHALNEIREITNKLGVTPKNEISTRSAPQPETNALSVMSAASVDMKAHKRALIKAKDKTLPALFKDVEEHSKAMATWMAARALSVKASLGSMQAYVTVIEERIFHVELYAGLTEEVECIQKGKPAPASEMVHLYQGMLYMDEESMIDYDAGGMEFKDIRSFDKWILRPHNLAAILPQPRCMVAFRVRNRDKEREGYTALEAYINVQLAQQDKRTFLYIRNGEQVYRLATEVDLRNKLFPDVSEFDFTQPLMADTTWSDVRNIITKSDWEAQVKEAEETLAAKQALHDQWERENKGKKGGHNPHHIFHSDGAWDLRRYTPFDKSSVKYDDIKAKIATDMQYYNRIVLILQGLFDRSPVFHPHPPAQLWAQDHFDKVVKLVYDRDRALYAGEKPDFDEYRMQGMSLLVVGSVVIGMQALWKALDKEKDDKKPKYDRRGNRVSPWKRYYDPGPGFLMTVTAIKGERVSCTYTKPREKRVRQNRYSIHAVQGMDAGDPMEATFSALKRHLFNASAYVPGEYKRFLSDPRTRAEYVKWAPFLLGSEDFAAGKRKVEHDRTKQGSYFG